MTTNDSQPKRLYRSEKDRLIAGVAGGIGEYFAIDPILIRVIFLVLAIAGGSGFIFYFVGWLIIPSESAPLNDDPAETIKANADKVAQEIKSRWQPGQEKGQLGLWLVVLGIVFLLANFSIITFAAIAKLWPLFLILAGWQLLVRPKR